MPTLWDMLNEREQAILRGYLPPWWQPPRPVGPPVQIEPLEEIAELLKAVPKGDAALVGRK